MEKQEKEKQGEIFLKITVKETDFTAERLRDRGLFFEEICGSLDLPYNQVVEIEVENYIEY